MLVEKFDGKLEQRKENAFDWLTQIFSVKELTEITKKACYENYKLSKINL
jgi:hypothetical protein